MQEEQLSSASTTFWKEVFPPLWTVVVGAGMLGIWLELFGQPASLGIKVLGGIMWLGTSVLFKATTRNLHHVRLGKDALTIGSDGRKVQIPLQDVTDISETRAQKIKTIKITLRPGSRLGPTLRFIPVFRFQAPFSEHPLIEEIWARKRLIAGSRESENQLTAEIE